MSSNISKTSEATTQAQDLGNNDASKYKRFLSWLASTWLIQRIGNTWLGQQIAYICSLIRDKFTTSNPSAGSKPSQNLNQSNPVEGSEPSQESDLLKQLLASISVPLETKHERLLSTDLLERRKLLLKFISDKWTVYADKLIEQNDETGKKLRSLIQAFSTYQFQPPSKLEEDEEEQTPLSDLVEFCQETPQLEPGIMKDISAFYTLEETIERTQKLEQAQQELTTLATTNLQLKHDITTEEGMFLQIQDEVTHQLNESMRQQLLQKTIDMHSKQYDFNILQFAKLTQIMFGFSIELDTEVLQDLLKKIEEDRQHINKLYTQLEHTKMLQSVVFACLAPTQQHATTAAELSAQFCLLKASMKKDKLEEILYKECKEYLMAHGQKAIHKLEGSETSKEAANKTLGSLCSHINIPETLISLIVQQAQKILEV